ncbi:protein BIG GRAIN 1-like A [Benincasa hispida]|uniref:protein BIG GRAIN 1-like A n=1 Tax=Benincasa hispida TaxID=102211 RepID=UPI0018FFACB0|nr:protein BIG GRAIN 1-like A [Benincasa hispida]
MKKWDYYEHKNPSFSSTLLDEIYRSIDDGEKKPTGETKFYRETSTVKKQIKSRAFEDQEMANLRRACMIEKWMEKKVGEKANVNRKQERYRKMTHDFDHDRDALFFTSTSSSSDSSSGGFSSSDTESVFGTRSLTPSSCFASTTLKAIRTGACVRPAETERKKSLFQGKNDRHVFDEFPKTKSSGLKKVKQPISPGVRLAGLINSLFTAGNTRRSKNTTATERKMKTGEESTCSSASSFARSCLSKSSPSSRGNGAKRSVRFCPVSVIFDEDCRPCGHKCLYEEDGSSLMPVSIPTAWKIGRSQVGKSEEKELKSQFTETSRKVEAAARELLIKNLNCNINDNDDNDGDDDNASCSSSDLFELEHLEMIGQRRYSQELPVYETTHVEKNRAISKGLLL